MVDSQYGIMWMKNTRLGLAFQKILNQHRYCLFQQQDTAKTLKEKTDKAIMLIGQEREEGIHCQGKSAQRQQEWRGEKKKWRYQQKQDCCQGQDKASCKRWQCNRVQNRKSIRTFVRTNKTCWTLDLHWMPLPCKIREEKPLQRKSNQWYHDWNGRPPL